jgi:hypothetical protein
LSKNSTPIVDGLFKYLYTNVVKLRHCTLPPLEKGRDEVNKEKLNLTTIIYAQIRIEIILE